MARPGSRSRWIYIAGAALLLLVAVALLVPFLVPADRFRPLLVRLIEGYTARDVQIGALRLRLVPRIRIQALDLRVKNPPGFPDGDTIVVKSIDLGIEPRALLSRRLEVTDITISGVSVNLLREASGRTNYAFAVSPPGSSKGAVAPGGSFLSVERVSAVAVRNVEVAFSHYDARRGRAVPSFTVGGVHATVVGVNPAVRDWAKHVRVTADLRGAQFSSPALTTPLAFQAGQVTIEGSAGQGTFAASLAGLRAEGTVTIVSLDPLFITFTATIPALDLGELDRLMASRPGRTSGIAAAPSQHRLLARGDVKAGTLRLPPLAAQRATGRLSVYADRIELDSYALAAYGGTVAGKATLDYSASSLPAAATARARGIDVGRLMSTLAPRARKITGTLEADIRLATALGRNPKAALTGAGTFAVRNGSFQGLDLSSNLAGMARAVQLNAPAGDTRFSYFGGDLRIAQQRVHSQALRLDAEGLEGTARGSFGFDRTLDYTGTGVLKNLTTSTSPRPGASPSGPSEPGVGLPPAGDLLGSIVPGLAGATGVRVPFFLRGTFDEPRFSLAGTPQLIRRQDRQPQQQAPQPQQPFQDLFDIFR